MDIGRLGERARRALIAEVDATPKPGLVDRRNCGAHRDMDRAAFHASANALLPYFSELARVGARTATLPPEQVFSHLRGLGIEAEKTMLQATGGVNTHKGAIFSLGLAVAGAGRLAGLGTEINPISILDAGAAFVSGICARELGRADDSKGRRAYIRYGVTGVRGEAERGFPHVRACALPCFIKALEQGAGENEALVHTLMALMAEVEDTNVLTRADATAAQYVREEAARFQAKKLPLGGAQWRDALYLLDDAFIARNLSPGGCADLAALTYFLAIPKITSDKAP